MAYLIFSVCLLLGSGIAFFVMRLLSQRIRADLARSAGKDQETLSSKIQEFDKALDASLDALGSMVSLDELSVLDEQLRSLHADIEKEKVGLQELETELGRLQSDVDTRESKHNKIKQGKEEASKLADTLRVQTEQLSSDARKLEGQLTDTQQQMESLAAGATLSVEQKAAFAEVNGSVKKLSEEFHEVTEVHNQAKDRFLNLENQYQELEKEYRKLVEIELSGTQPE